MIRKLSDVTDIIAGYAFKSNDFGTDFPDKVIKITHIVPPNVDMDGLSSVDMSKYDRRKLEKYIAREGDYVFAMTGATIGKIGRLEKGEAYLNQRVMMFKPNSRIDKDFLYYVLLQNNFYQYVLNHIDSESAQPNISAGTIAKYEFDLPEMEIQRKIGKVLRLYDEKIETNRCINNNLLEQAQAVFLHFFAGNESVISATIADVALNVTDGVHNTVHDDPEGEYLLLSCKNIKGGSLCIGASERRINSETFEKLRRRTKLAKGDVLISSVGTVGELLLLNTDPSNYEFQRSVAIVKPNPEIVSPAYLYESLVCRKAELINAAHGAVQQCLFISDIAGFPIGIPTSEDLRVFNELVTPMFDEITANEAESIRLSAIRDTLLPHLMSGELDVSDIDF